MPNLISEANYPITFRESLTRKLGEHLKKRHSVVLIGMRRVGISNYLRFFLNHKDIVKTYLDNGQNHLFIAVDLNDLVEIDLYPFWMLTLKRIIDSSEKSSLNSKIKKDLQRIFLDCIQSQDLFLLMDSIRHSLIRIIEAGFIPTIFFNRFDRIKDIINTNFFSNIEGLRDATHQKLAFVFTSFRNLNELFPGFANTALYLMSDIIFLKPDDRLDQEIIYKEASKHYHLNLSKNLRQELFNLVDGHVQYLLLSLITLSQSEGAISEKDLRNKLLSDENIKLQSEELWESLDNTEKEILSKIVLGKKLNNEEHIQGKYLFDTNLISKQLKIFSPLFQSFVKERLNQETENSNSDFSKKEFLLFNFLKVNLNEIIEREQISLAVWPEEEELGVSDWAIDRLVARLRNKLKQQSSNYEIVTIKTRGFKLITT